MMRTIALSALLVVSAGADAFAQASSNSCRFAPLRFCDDCVVTRTITVAPGGTCAFDSRAGGALLGHDTLVRPRLGIFGMASESQAAYRAGASAGTDYFEYRIRWERLGRPTSTTIRNQVTIVPGG